MNLEKMLIEKKYYESFMEGQSEHPAAVLAEAYLEARERGEEGLQEIRFAQGEVYFGFRDYEAAIQKWEGISGSLKSWSVKNTADSYYELGELAKAEDLYRAAEPKNNSLKAEVALQLFALYIEKGKEEAASDTIKGLIAENPGYPDAASLARNFFESRGDWSSATDLAANELERTKTTDWADVLISYVDRGATSGMHPAYFMKVLAFLYELDKDRFGHLAASLWKNYFGTENYFAWINEFNALLAGLSDLPNGEWPELTELYKEAYLDFTTSGNYSIQSLSGIMPPLLKNWLDIEDRQTIGLAASALLAWSGKYPGGISAKSIETAETALSHSKRTENDFTEGLSLLSEIAAWSNSQGMQLGPRFEWIAGELANFRTRHVVTVGMQGSGKAHVLRNIFGDAYPDGADSGALAFKYQDEAAVSKVTDEGIDEVEVFEELTSAENGNGIISFSLPIPFLKDSGLSFIDLPEFEDETLGPDEMEYIHLADSLLVTVESREPLTTPERIVIGQIREMQPGLPIHFLLTQTGEPDPYAFEQAAMQIKASFPDSEVIKAGPSPDRNYLFEDIVKAAVIGTPERSIIGSRSDKLLLLIRRALDHLLLQRTEQEKGIQDKIENEEQMASKLTGAIHQLNDIESEKIEKIQKSYRLLVDEAKAEMLTEIPEILRGTADVIKEDSDFRNIHLDLNEEMNRRLNEYMNGTAMPKLRTALEQWIEETGGELIHIQEYLDEMSDGFNKLYGQDWIRLDCDFRIVEDWKRDIGRMTNGYQLDKVNILLRRTPSQIFLKGAGKLFGALPQNNAMLYNRYKTYVETEDYLDTARHVNDRFFLQFDLFEKAIGRDISLFFHRPHEVLDATLRDTQAQLENSRSMADDMKKNPQRFHDPVALFSIRLRQLEWLEIVGNRL
ncbi:GTP-binding protein [Neobacillus notoginsengisoli]|uniref:GTP-binding protein n=1 Tax=Neobacillus notoginsengisoli TaxID=1578198 RepID=A0A417YVR5_9BACI|nr:GTP-binding protein [Neobacillus notoginsengisoli]RHW41487.1 GTP-binding protein [Neobacillus notoginsengisoli]